MRTLSRTYGATLVAALILPAGFALAETPAAGPLTDTGAFRAAFKGSFYGFDVCGDAADGALYRKALTEKVEHCPFSKDAKAAFRQWASDAGPRGTADVQRYIAEHDRLPASLDPKKKNCAAERQSDAYQKVIVTLAAYAKGAAGFDTVVPDPCDAKAGTP